MGGESGSADTARDPRGFAVKFYSEEGNWDLVGNNTPIFFIRDPILFPRCSIERSRPCVVPSVKCRGLENKKQCGFERNSCSGALCLFLRPVSGGCRVGWLVHRSMLFSVPSFKWLLCAFSCHDFLTIVSVWLLKRVCDLSQ